MSQTPPPPLVAQVEPSAMGTADTDSGQQPFRLTMIKADLIRCYLALEDDERHCLFCLAMYAACGSYQKVSDLLVLSGKTSVRRKIKRIGKVLGLTLVERSPKRGTQLTSAGKAVAKLVRPSFRRGIELLVTGETPRQALSGSAK